VIEVISDAVTMSLNLVHNVFIDVNLIKL